MHNVEGVVVPVNLTNWLTAEGFWEEVIRRVGGVVGVGAGVEPGGGVVPVGSAQAGSCGNWLYEDLTRWVTELDVGLLLHSPAIYLAVYVYSPAVVALVTIE